MASKNDSPHPLCLVPWLSAYLAPDGTIRPCCVSKDILGNTLNGDTLSSTWNNEAFRRLRRKFLEGKFPQGCSSCLAKEEISGRSHRTLFFETYHDVGKGDPEFVENPPLKPLRLDFSFSNQCNLRCRFCGPWNSTKWIQDAKKISKVEGLGFYGGVQPTIKQSLSQFIELVDQNENLALLELKGGEPFLERDLPAALEYLVSKGRAPQIQLQISTNGTVIQRETKDLLSRFKKVFLSISVEAIGSLYRYLRGESFDLEVVTQNLRFYDEIPTVEGNVHMAMSAYSIFQPAEVQSWLSKLSTKRFLKLTVSPVVSSPHLNPGVLPRKIRQKASRLLLGHPLAGLRAVGNYLSKEMPLDAQAEIQAQLFRKFILFTNELDRIRGYSLREADPELAELFRLPSSLVENMNM